MESTPKDPKSSEGVDEALIDLMLVGLIEVVGIRDGQFVYALTGLGSRSERVRQEKLRKSWTIRQELIDRGMQLGWDS